MKYFLDTEFHEYKKKNINTIELISIGIVSEGIKYAESVSGGDPKKPKDIFKCKEYYAISKDFDLKSAWKNKWLRENVLRSLFKELLQKIKEEEYKANQANCSIIKLNKICKFNFKNFKYLINRYGKSNKLIAEEIKEFTNIKEKEYPVKCQCGERDTCYECETISEYNNNLDEEVEFYAYYADYDWVVFCWLFGRMIDLPKGFPMYCRDLKQMLDESVENYDITVRYFKESNLSFLGLDGYKETTKDLSKLSLEERLEFLKEHHSSYPKQYNEHNALDDARWNEKLYEFLNKLNEQKIRQSPQESS